MGIMIIVINCSRLLALVALLELVIWNLHMQTALSDMMGLRGSRRSHRCVKVSMEQLAMRWGTLECQSMSVTIRVCARKEWMSRGSPTAQVTTSIS